MSLRVQALHDIFRDLDTALIGLRFQKGGYLQTRLGSRAANVSQHRFKGASGFASPVDPDSGVDADGLKQPVFDRVPLGSGSGILADSHFRTQSAR
jgi:hypothetical protein